MTEISSPDVAREAHKLAEKVGKKYQPKRGDTAGQLRKFNLSEPPFIPAETNEAGIASIREELREKIAVTENDETKGALQERLDNLTVENLPPAPDQEPSGKLMEEIDTLQIRTDPETGQGFNTVYANREVMRQHPDRAVTVYHGLYGNIVGRKDESRLRLLELARQMPDRALIAFDYPEMGGSDSLTDEQKSTNKKDSYFGIADAELRILQDMGVTKINLVGISMGGFASISIAARAKEFGIDVENVIAIGTPGVKHSIIAPLIVHELTALRKIDLHHSSPADPRMWEYLEGSGKLKPPAGIWNQDPWFRYARMMTKGMVKERAQAVLHTQPDAHLLFVNGSLDKTSPVKSVNKVVAQLQDEFGYDRSGHNKRVAQVIRPGEGHLAMVHPKLLAPLVKSQLDGFNPVQPQEQAA